MTDRHNVRGVHEQTLPESDSKLRITLESARQERDQVRQILDLVTHMIVALNREGRITMINRAGCRILGFEEHELIGKDWFSTCLPIGVGDESRDRFRRVIAGEKPISETYQNSIVTRDGGERFVDWRNAVLTDVGGRIVGTLSYGDDITERERAENALRQSEERQRLLLEGVRVIFWEADPKTLSFTYVTGQALALTGYAPEQWYAPDFWVDHLHPEDRDEAVGHCLAAVQRREPHELEYRMRKADGQWIWLRDIVSVLLGPAGVQLLRGVLVDITDRKTAEEQVARQQAELAHVARVSTMGEMASGLAHELNQPLTAVVNFAHGALLRLRSDASVHQDVLEAIETASDQAHRAAEIIRRLTSFVQKREPRRSSCDLNQTIREVIGFSAAEARDHHVKIRLHPTVDLPLVQADDIQIQQVILNLVRNGIEAMTEVESPERILEIRTSPIGDAVEVAVRDNGSGLTPEAQERIFTPFFTTKPQGMGMGLSISRSIIDAHGGRLWATPNPDGGTTFQFTIPVSCGAKSDETRSDHLRSG